MPAAAAATTASAIASKAFSIDTIIKSYGPHAFGLITVLVIWFAMMKPQLDAARVDFSRMEDITKSLDSVSNNLEHVVKSNERISANLESAAKILERVTERQATMLSIGGQE